MELNKQGFRDYAKSHNLTILTFLRGNRSGVFTVAVQETSRYDGVPIFNFGRLYHVFGEDYVYNQQGCYFTTDEKEIRLRAYKFFGIN